MSGETLRVFTLNCWGLKYVSKYRDTRVAAIARYVSQSDYDIITLQELWVFSDYEHVRAAVSKRLPYAKFFYSGALGSGLAIFSRFPIIAATVHPYSVNGSPIDVLAGDWFVGKAAASVLIAHPTLGQVQIFNTHLFAKGGDEGPEYQKAHRLVNAWEFAKLARQAAELGRYVIAAGDFNSVPDAPPMSIVREHASLKDAWIESHGHVRTPSLSNPPSPIDAIHIYGVTADSPLNSFSAGKPLEPYARRFQGKRLDYIFYRSPTASAGDKIPGLRCVNSKVMLTEMVPGYPFSYSDHFGLETTLEISTPGPVVEEATATYPIRSADPQFALSSVPNPQPKPSGRLSPEIITSTLRSLTARYRYAQSQARFHLTVFAASLAFLLCLIIGSAWLPHSWITPIFMVAAMFFAWLATTMLYIGFVYGKWETNALTNTIEELEIYKSSLEDRGSLEQERRS